MIVVDTSAVVAMMTEEPGGEDLAAVLAGSPAAFMSAATAVELGTVLEGRVTGSRAAGAGDRFLRDSGIEVVAVDRAHVDRALEGWRRFGKGRHPAALNFGDCFTYALAATTGHPVLCTGNDFAQTDVEVVPIGA